ncbi:DUF1670 domain-containing protein [Bacteroidales bacterium OttesenSCG-928-K03]|nr:DUF1670 domain-containing protein [Odoribacter sp. OttesenSCG-928-L07]MDL2239656.1 DUF1670 domain-containing protein [Bacteroidales bacterium OttesenSCG-928-L14]MDL2243142.1 DUF1670 domain-containing protein [Bacteroidales bacterium OttesenSCG-928-K03]
MNRQPDGIRKYHTAYDRFLKPAIVNFFEREFSGYFGPIVRENISDALIEIFEKNAPQKDTIKHGQMLWNALDKYTRADSPKRRYKPVVLTLVAQEDIKLFEKQTPVRKIKKQVMARIIREAYQQGGILSNRDCSLILSSNAAHLSTLRSEYEKENKTILPHTGVIHDMGSTITHKVMIVFKHVVEKKATNIVARETNHSQKAVDRYINDYYRVKTLIDDNKDINYIHLATNIAKHVILQYQDIINQYVKER